MKEEQAVAGELFQQSQQPKAIDHSQMYYRIDEVYSIRKDSINNSNDQIYKRLSRQFQKIKKIKSQPNSAALLSAQYDYDSSPFRRQLKRIHEQYNQSSKSHIIVKRRIEKMRSKVDKIKGEVEKDQFTAIKEIDPFKLIGKGGQGGQNQGQGQGSQSINNNTSKNRNRQ